MKEEWLFPEAVVPVDAETTAALVAEIHRLIDVVGGIALAQPDAFEQGRQEGMKQERAMWELSKLGQEIEAQPEQPEQEPVAIVDANDEGYWADILPDRSVKVGQLLYATPPQRPWAGLTDEEIEDCMEMSIQKTCRAIEAKLKEKNA